MRPVNLLPSEVAAARVARRRSAVPVLAAAAAPVVAAAAVGVAWTTQRGHVSERGRQLAAVQAQVDALQNATHGTDAQLAALETSRRTALEDALAKQLAWDTTLDGIARVLPSGVKLTELGLQSPTPAGVASAPPTTTAATTTTTSTTTTAAVTPAAPVTQGLTMSGSAPSHAVVAYTMARLALVPGVSDVTLQTSAGSTDPKSPGVVFQLSATLTGSAS